MAELQTHHLGIIMNGVTGRMGTNQHLIRSICAIIEQGGVKIAPDEVILPAPLLVGRNPAKLETLAQLTGIQDWTTDLGEALDDEAYSIYFDALTTSLRPENVKRALAAGKHVYCEKPTALTADEAYELYRLAKEAGVRHGVVQDKLWLPGLVKLRRLVETGFFGRILAIRGEFGYWVFTGEHVPAQRPSWNYRKQEGGSLITDMFCHWRYVLDNLFGEVRSVCARGARHIPKRWDERGRPYDADADDAAYALFELEGDVLAQFNSSWCTRVRRDDLLTIHVDGTEGSAVAGLRECWVQPAAATPRPIWNPDVDQPIDFRDGWQTVPDQAGDPGNAFKVQWERFLKHLVKDEPFPWDLREGAKGVQLAEAAFESWEKRRWVDLTPLEA